MMLRGQREGKRARRSSEFFRRNTEKLRRSGFITARFLRNSIEPHGFHTCGASALAAFSNRIPNFPLWSFSNMSLTKRASMAFTFVAALAAGTSFAQPPGGGDRGGFEQGGGPGGPGKGNAEAEKK